MTPDAPGTRSKSTMTPTLNLDTLTLGAGGHTPGASEMCVMEAAAYMAGEPWSDHPTCVSPVIAAFLRSWNDALPDGDRNQLVRYLANVPDGGVLGTAPAIPELENRRSWLAVDWSVRVHTPAWLRLAGLDDQAATLENLPEILNPTTAAAIRPALAAVRKDAVAAWDAARDAAGDAAGDAAWVAAWDAAWAAARDAGGDAAGAAAWAAAGDAAGDAARAAAGDAAMAAAMVAARAAAWDAAMAAGGDAAGAAAWDAAGDAAGDAAMAAAGDAAMAAAMAAARAAAWDAARAAAMAAARVAAVRKDAVAAWDAARAAAGDAAGDAAWVAARAAAWAAARAAGGDAAMAAARAALAPTVAQLQESAHELVVRMATATEEKVVPA